MAKHPTWDYWLEEHTDGKLVIFDRPDSERDIRHKNYDLDVAKWCDEVFWSADEAALISFSRDPGKIAKTSPESSPLHMSSDDPLFEEHNTLMGHMDNLCTLIKGSQNRQQLPEDFFPATTYIKWAERVGVSIPTSVLHQLNFAERERRGEIGSLNLFEAARFGRKPRYVSSDENEPEQTSRKNRGPSKRSDNNSVKLILAILKVAGLHKDDVMDLTDRIQTVLRKLAEEKQDESFLDGVGRTTITSRLDAAHELLK